MKLKHILFIIITTLVLVFAVVIPTFSKFKSGVEVVEWDGSVALAYKSGNGTLENPYIISTAAEFAYLSESLSQDNYEGKYFKITKDIIINKGIFINNDDLTYIYNDNNYYIDYETGKYYSDTEHTIEVGSINILPTLKGFKGHLDGDFHTIYGFYKTGIDSMALFDDFEGSLENLYIDNSLLYGGYLSSCVILNATNANIKNVIFNGTVLANNIERPKITNKTLSDINVLDNYEIDLEYPINIADKYVFKGNCDGSEFILNGNIYSCSNFEIEVDSNKLLISTNEELNFTNLSYDTYFMENKSAGIVLNADNSTISGVVNKGYISNIYSSGIVGTSLNTDISNSYNNGQIKGTYASGVVDTFINGDIVNVYNNSEIISSNSIGLINNYADIDMVNSFNVYNTKALGNSLNDNVILSNNYNIRNYTDSYNNELGLLDLSYIKTYYPSYIDMENTLNGNLWVGDEVPILYFDDIKNRTVQIKVENNTWDKYTANIDDLIFNNDINVILSTTDIFKPIKEVYYYLSDIQVSKTDLANSNWQEYTGAFKLSNEGVYIVYVKYVDYNDNIYYINSDKLIIDLNGSNITIRSGNMTWNEYHEVKNVYNDTSMSYIVDAHDNASGIKKIEYIISDTSKTITELNNLENWNNYNNELTIDNSKYILYVKVTDNSDYVTYANTDQIIKTAFHITSVNSGDNMEFSRYMTNTSSFNFTVSLNHELINASILNRYISTNVELPIGIELVLKDMNSKNVYTYITENGVYDESVKAYLYPLTKFKEVGKATFDNYFDNRTYDTSIEENFNISVDFKGVSNVNESITFAFIGKIGDDIIRLGNNENITVNLYDIGNHNYLSVNTSFNDNIYNNDTKIVPISINVNEIINNNIKVVDTNIYGMHNGISISVVDESGSVISREYYKDLRFKYNGNIYVPSYNNKTNIDLGNNVSKNINLDVITNNVNLNGTYYLKITGYLSIDGINKEYETDNYVLIPLVVERHTSDGYTFNVDIESNIIDKVNGAYFDIDASGLDNPKLHVSLYKKKTLTAYNQEYVLVDLADYVNGDLNEIDNNIYEFNLADINFTFKDVENNGYKFLFELYDGDYKITEESILTIIRG